MAIDVEAENVVPLPPITLEAALPPDRTKLVLTIRALDGSDLNSSHSGSLELQSKTELTDPLGQWLSLDQVFAAIGGTLVTELPIEGSPVLFLRVRANGPN